ncbi:unnamed protein product [Calypogeia fissa]
MAGAHFRSLIRVYHNDNGVLKSLRKFDLSESTLEAISRGERSISTKFFSRRDMKRLKRMGLQTESDVDLVVVFPWNATAFVTIVAKANDTQLRRQVVGMAVDRIRKTASLNKIVAMKEVPEYTIRENPYLGPGHAPYENFIDSLLKVTDTSTTVGKELSERFLESAADDADESALTCVEKLGLRTVFHGTDHSFIDSILKSGLDPKCRRSGLTEDYFGLEYFTSLDYTTNEEDGSKLLVFLVIKAPDAH